MQDMKDSAIRTLTRNFTSESPNVENGYPGRSPNLQLFGVKFLQLAYLSNSIRAFQLLQPIDR